MKKNFEKFNFQHGIIFDSEVDEIKIPKFGIYFRVSGIAPEKGIKFNRKFFEKLFKKTNGKCGIKKVVDCKIYETIFCHKKYIDLLPKEL